LAPDARFAMADDAPMITPNAYLTKPLDIARFLEEVGALAGQPREQAAGAGGR
jgi:hypothetical protein